MGMERKIVAPNFVGGDIYTDDTIMGMELKSNILNFNGRINEF